MADPGYVKRFDRAVQAVLDIDDPLERLDAARRFRERLELLEAGAARDAREAGATWKDIGSLYGLSKQGAQQRFRAGARAEHAQATGPGSTHSSRPVS